jgi:DNA-binding CsgD family transcriptional regulator
MCATACCLLGRVDEATRWLLGAMRITLPYGFTTPFAENISAFGGLLEKLLEREYPAYYDVMVNQWNRTLPNWTSFHNLVTKNNFAVGLSLRDFEIAIKVAKGEPHKEIAEHFHMSQGRLRNKISEIYSEMHINSRKELEGLLLFGKKQT